MGSHSLPCPIIKRPLGWSCWLLSFRICYHNLPLKGRSLFDLTKYYILNLVSGEMAVSQLLFLRTRSKERNAATLIANGPKGIKKLFRQHQTIHWFSLFSGPSWITLLEKLGSNCCLQVKNRNARARCKICSKLTIKTPERCQWCVSHLVTVFLLLTFSS